MNPERFRTKSAACSEQEKRAKAFYASALRNSNFRFSSIRIDRPCQFLPLSDESAKRIRHTNPALLSAGASDASPHSTERRNRLKAVLLIASLASVSAYAAVSVNTVSTCAAVSVNTVSACAAASVNTVSSGAASVSKAISIQTVSPVKTEICIPIPAETVSGITGLNQITHIAAGRAGCENSGLSRHGRSSHNSKCSQQSSR